MTPRTLTILFLLFAIHGTSQDVSIIRISPTFEWVDEKETRTIHSFEGGGHEYSYDVLVNRKLDHIDSVVVWVDGKKELLPGKKLDEYGNGSFDIKETADSVWFYYNRKRAEFYYHSSQQWSTSNFNIYFIEKPHLFIQVGAVNLPFDINSYMYTVIRNFETCPDNGKWHNYINTVSGTYNGVTMTQDDHFFVLNFFGQDKAYIQKVLNAVQSNKYVAHVSAELKNIVYNQSTFFIDNQVHLHTLSDSEKVNAMAKKYGFEMVPDRSGYQDYTLRYTKSKLLGTDFIKNSMRLINSVNAFNATHDFFSEVRMD